MKRKTNISQVITTSGTAAPNLALAGSPATRAPAGRLERIQLAEIQRAENGQSGGNPRTSFDAHKLTELTASLKELGLLEPIVVLPRGTDGRYPLVAGERRIRAAAQAGWTEIDAIIKRVDELQPRDAPVARIVENLIREDLSRADLARGLRNLVEHWGETLESAGKKLGRSKSWMSAQLAYARLIDEVPEAQALDYSSAERIARLPDPRERQRSVKETLALVSAGATKRDAAQAVTNGKTARGLRTGRAGHVITPEAAATQLSTLLARAQRLIHRIPQKQRKLRQNARKEIEKLLDSLD
jgi:ParB/RepB/Spo0J family partition protein